jgi:hypothetical protein
MIELVAAPTLVRLRPVDADIFYLLSGIRRLLFPVVLLFWQVRKLAPLPGRGPRENVRGGYMP